MLEYLRSIIRVVLSGYLMAIPLATLADEGASCNHDETTFRCVKYVKNYDGDTITFEIPNVHPLIGHNISIRVRSVDAPELKTKDRCEHEKALVVKNYVTKLLRSAKRIDLIDVGRDKYFRILADVRIDGVSLTHSLISNGYAYPYSGGTKQHVNWCVPLKSLASGPNSTIH